MKPRRRFHRRRSLSNIIGGRIKGVAPRLGDMTFRPAFNRSFTTGSVAINGGEHEWRLTGIAGVAMRRCSALPARCGSHMSNAEKKSGGQADRRIARFEAGKKSKKVKTMEWVVLHDLASTEFSDAIQSKTRNVY